MAITAMVATVLSASLSQHTRLARTQIAAADLRQSMRVALMDLQRAVRAAGFGGLPWRRAVETVQNVQAGTRIGRQRVAEGSDILIVRGAFSGVVWRTDPANPKSFTRSEARAVLDLKSPPRSAARRALKDLADRLQSSNASGRPPEILVLRGPFQTYGLAIVRSLSFLSDEAGVESGLGDQARLELELPSSESEVWGGLADLQGPVGQGPLQRVRSAALLEEHHLFIRVPDTAELGGGFLDSPRRERRFLSRARLIPGSDRVYNRESGAVLDIAEGIRDLQVSLAVSEGPRRTGTEEDPVRGWRYGPQELDVKAVVELPLLRLSVLGESSFPDRGYVSKPIRTLENHRYDEISPPAPGTAAERRYRRLQSRVLVSLRNP